MKKFLLILMFISFLNANAQNPIQEFNFNGTLASADNTISLLGTPNFVNDRAGVAKGAQRLTNKVLQAVVGDLPQDRKPRSISVWVKFNTVAAINYIFGYGSTINTQYFGLLQQAAAAGNSDVSLLGWGDVNNVVVSVPLQKEVWYQYNITYDGTSSKIYRNGELLKSEDGIPRATKGYILRLGQLNNAIGINADIDDLKIYNVAMTAEQVMESYNSSKPIATTAAETAQTSGSVKKVVTAPVTKASVVAKSASPAIAPTNDATVTKTVEVFSQGRQIIGSNASNIGELPEGTYLIKVTRKK